MRWLKMWTLFSLLTLWLVTGCNAATTTEPEATVPENEPTTESESATQQPTWAAATTVPLPTSTDTDRDNRLTPAATPQGEIVPTVDEAAVVGEVPEEIMTAIYQDLLTAENVTQEAITVTRAESIIWNDGSLGCPRPGEVYTQATVPGYWIVLEANGRTYDYHAAEKGYFVLCQSNLPVPPPAGTPTS